MALNVSTVHTPKPPVSLSNKSYDAVVPLLAAALLSAYGIRKSRKQLRKLKWKLAGTVIKQKIASLFRKPADISNRTLILILLGIIFLALLFIEPLVALIVALVALILILADVV